MLENQLEDSNRKLSRRSLLSAGLAFAVPASLMLDGCEKSPQDKAPGISPQLQSSWPIWSAEDLAINKPGGGSVKYAHEMNLKPDFYKGRMPLKFESTHDLRGMVGGMGGPKICFSHKFKDFSNYFVYDSVWLKGAVAVDKTNTMVAEAKFDYVKGDGIMMVPRIEEFHYSGGLMVYHCFSELENSTGIKKREMQKSGRKKRDYFFLMPIGINE